MMTRTETFRRFVNLQKSFPQPKLLWQTPQMLRIRGRIVTILTAILAVVIIATGAPVSEIHAHERDSMTQTDDGLGDHLGSHHRDAPSGGELHMHEHGLFAQFPAVMTTIAMQAAPPSVSAAAPELALPRVLSHTTPPLRPPARA